MKIKELLLLFVFALIAQSTFAINPEEGNPKDKDATTYEEYIDHGGDDEDLTSAELRRQRRLERHNKRLQWLSSKVIDEEPKAIDLQDPVEKWLWFAIFGWGAAILLSIILAAAPWSFWTLGWIIPLAGLFGTISFIIWLIKKFAD